MAFVKYTDTSRSHAAKASIGYPSGLLGFNDAARRRFKMDDFGYVILYYDAEEHRIGVELTKAAEAEGAKKIRFRPTGADVSIKGFLDFFEVEISKTTSYDVRHDPDSRYLILDLKSGRERGASRKSDDGFSEDE